MGRNAVMCQDKSAELFLGKNAEMSQDKSVEMFHVKNAEMYQGKNAMRSVKMCSGAKFATMDRMLINDIKPTAMNFVYLRESNYISILLLVTNILLKNQK